MSYQSYLKSTATFTNKNPSPGSIHRKPPPSITPSGSSIRSSVTRNDTPTSTVPVPFTPASSTSSPARPAAFTPLPSMVSSAAHQDSTRTPLTKEQIDAAVRICLDLQKTATSLHDKRPFAALLLGSDNSTILLSHYSISHVQHAETELARLAAIHFSQKYLASCTLVSTWEPCAMCTGTIYWSNIGRLVYAASEEKLKDLTGGNNEENMTMSLPCREVLKHGQKDVEVIGPISGWEETVVEESGKWWKEQQARENAGRLRGGSVNGTDKPGSLSSMRHGTPTTWTGEETVLSSIDDEGEYKAELDIDWMR
ncbi:CMP/dCMP deaminase [Cladophialophora carrionii]|uniref:CMP/dCMP deaminase n=1 Tax=Cladophialophora carrionii TaxID=86049 RepID=A0A1C1D356_9EURO|nr:CMP/dCMP deaminase [Cladophialophora carrionii]